MGRGWMRGLIVQGLLFSGLACACLSPAARAQEKEACALSAPDAVHAGAGCESDWFNANLRLNQLQFVGTAESYKLAPSPQMMSLIRMGGKKDAQALDFTMPSLTAQLEGGARALQFDIAYDPRGGLFRNPAGASMAGELLDPGYQSRMSQPGFKVIHVLDVDFRSSCLTLKACLDQVAAWSRAHPDHMPLFIGLRSNDSRTPMPGATRPLPFDEAAMDALDREIRGVFRPGELLTPDQVRGEHASLREAVLSGGWPVLGAARGKVILVLDDDAAKVELYGARGLNGRVLFVTAPEQSPNAAFLAIDNPLKDAARIVAAVKAGFIVRTRADAQTVEARAANARRRDQAFAAGAQIIATNFPQPDRRIGPYQVTISDPRHVLCDSVNANCVGWNAPAAPVMTATAH